MANAITKPIAMKLAEVQKQLHAPKSQENKFGGYKYRSCEDILQAVKPLLGEMVIVITDEIVMVADRIYVKATATLTDGESSISTSAFAREALTKKGQDESQITGSASSYARKYALNGLLLIDDNKDADSQDNREQPAVQPKRVGPNEINQLRKAMQAAEVAEDRFCLRMQIGTLEELPLAAFAKAIAKLNQQAKEKAA
jgi:hypothetical protein